MKTVLLGLAENTDDLFVGKRFFMGMSSCGS